MTSLEFAHWKEHWKRFPWGRESWQMAELLTMFYARNRGKGTKKITNEQFGGGAIEKKQKTRKQLISAFHQHLLSK